MIIGLLAYSYFVYNKSIFVDITDRRIVICVVYYRTFQGITFTLKLGHKADGITSHGR